MGCPGGEDRVPEATHQADDIVYGLQAHAADGDQAVCVEGWLLWVCGLGGYGYVSEREGGWGGSEGERPHTELYQLPLYLPPPSPHAHKHTT